MAVEVKEAVKLAKQYVSEIFEVERTSLEEVWFDEGENEWSVTIGIRHKEIGVARSLLSSAFETEIAREIPEYKVVRIDAEDGKFVAIQNYDRVAAE